MSCDSDKLVLNLSMIQQALRDIRRDVPDKCQAWYLDTIIQLARIDGFVRGQDAPTPLGPIVTCEATADELESSDAVTGAGDL